ncbi:MAG: BrnA antitoxin family protein [Burkholderiaceae bacterium]
MDKEYDFSKGKRGAVIPSPGKTRITIMLDNDVIEQFRAKAEAQGIGYQTMINAALRESLKTKKGRASESEPLTAEVLRKILREELQAG